jgi:hypothetical protein
VEAVPATSGVRRTVRLAGALVVGQLLLVAVVGWVTFTRGDDRRGNGAPAVDQLAAPPAVIVPPPVPPAVTRTTVPGAGPTSGGGTAVAGRRRGHTGGHAPSSTPRPAASDLPASSAAPATTAPPVPPTTVNSPTANTPAVGSVIPPLTLVPPSSSAPSPTASDPILPGRPCIEIFASARAVDGRPVRCLPTPADGLRWKIV